MQISSAVKTPVHEDKSFLSTYHKIDTGYNDIVESNEKFNTKYNVEININDKIFGLYIADVFYSQRVIEDKSTHKDMFSKGTNHLSVKVTDKSGNSIDAIIKFKVTRGTNSYSDVDVSNEESKLSSFDFDLSNVGNWNITGTIEVNENDKGYFYIKSNAINR